MTYIRGLLASQATAVCICATILLAAVCVTMWHSYTLMLRWEGGELTLEPPAGREARMPE